MLLKSKECLYSFPLYQCKKSIKSIIKMPSPEMSPNVITSR